MPRRIQVEEGSGNVFADIGLPNPEEALAKAEIARQVNRILTERGLNQVQAGALLRIAQPRVSDLARGRLGKFSLEKLLQFARLTGIDVRSEEHTSEHQSPCKLVCRFPLQKKQSSGAPARRGACVPKNPTEKGSGTPR